MFQTFPLMIWRLIAILMIVATLTIARGLYLRRSPAEGGSGAIAQVFQIIALLSFVAYIIFVNRDRLAL